MKRLLWLGLLLLVPGVAAGFTPASDVRSYGAVVYGADSTVNEGEVSASFTVDVPHDFAVHERHSWFEIDINYLLEGGVGTRVKEFTFETAGGHECSWRVSIGSNLQALNSYRRVACESGDTAAGVHSFWINGTQISGSDPITWSQYSITLYQREQINMSTTFETMTGLTALEFTIAPAVAFLGVLLWSRSTDGFVRFFGATLVFVSGLLLLFFGVAAGFGEVWAGTQVLMVLFMATGVYLVVRFGIDALTEADI